MVNGDGILMSQIYAIKLDNNLSQQQYEILLSKISQEKQNSIRKYVSRKDALRSLIADLFIRSLIMEKFQIPNEQITFEHNAYGKPFVKGLPSFHFNLSHSGHWVVCATDYQPVGVDIEQIHPIDYGIAYSYFSELEIQDLEEKKGREKLAYFYDLWSLKESYIKMEGKGLSIPLNSFTCRAINHRFLFSCDNQIKNAYFQQYHIDHYYRLSLCQKHPDFSECIHVIPLEEFVNTLLNEIYNE